MNPIRLLPVLKLWVVVLNQRWFCSWGIWQCPEGCFETAITQDSTHPQIIILPQMLTARTGENTFTSTLLPLHCAYKSLGILIQVQILSKYVSQWAQGLCIFSTPRIVTLQVLICGSLPFFFFLIASVLCFGFLASRHVVS